jgi:hypothetical protein
MDENEIIGSEGVTASTSPINGGDQPTIDNQENHTLAESPTISTEITAPVEVDPLEGFNPDDYKDGVEGDERHRILDLYLGFLVGQQAYYDPIAIRHPLVKWDTNNRPPLGIKAINAHIKANHAKWLRHHYLHRTSTWAGVKIR